MRSIDVYLCRESRQQAGYAARNALWAAIAVDYNKQLGELFEQVTLSNGPIDFNKKIIGET
jgi:hypothetical protein